LFSFLGGSLSQQIYADAAKCGEQPKENIWLGNWLFLPDSELISELIWQSGLGRTVFYNLGRNNLTKWTS